MKKILIAEDSITQALQLQMILEDHNFEVMHGINGEEAFDLIDENNPPDIVITDIVMPVMDGYELCAKIKGNEGTKDIPVILLTQLSDPDDVIKGLEACADNFISKPYTEQFLLERISDMLLNLEMRRRSPNLDLAMEIYFGGKKHKLNSNRMQILDLLLSTYYNAINKNRELEDKNDQLAKLHKELNIKNIQLKKSIDEKNHFLGIAAHDLRSPLATVSSCFSLITETLDKNSMQGQETLFESIHDTLDYMLNLISDVLDYAKIESSNLKLNLSDFNFITFINKAVDLNNVLSIKKNIKIHFDNSIEEIPVRADYNKLRQVMDNLLSNAMKYSERDTNIYVQVVQSMNGVIVRIRDEGSGIPKHEIGKIFDPFNTSSVQSTAGETSTGLGLVSVKKIVESHGGEILVESDLGVGSVFSFRVPNN